MAKLTNKYGLPQTLMNYANRNTYSRGNANISVTQLIGSPRVRMMTQKHQGILMRTGLGRALSAITS